MSIYNVSIHIGKFSLEVIREAWLGLPIAYVIAMLCDWFIVSRLAKNVAFKYLLKPDSAVLKKAITISCCMVVPMVIIMSMYGAIEVTLQSREWGNLFIIWMKNIPLNFIMALPLQLIIAGPIVRILFRKAFPEGKVLA
jgi:hypothetical protein